MIITKSPFRISFVGGGSDLEDYYKFNGGAVLSTTIDKYMYISSHRYFVKDHIRLKYSKTETVDNIDLIEHPIFKEVLTKFNINGALEFSSNADVPSGTGLGSSSSFTVNLLLNNYARLNQQVSKHQLAKEACNIEINRCNDPIGKQDQYAAAFGGLNIIIFKPNGDVVVEPLYIKSATKKTLDDRLMMFYTGEQRSAGDILKDQKQQMKQIEKRQILDHMVQLVWDCKQALFNDDLQQFGEILHKNWQLKQQLSAHISNSTINTYYNKAITAGAVGGKLLGAGESGFLLFYCAKQYQPAVRAALSDCTEMPFTFETEGARVIYYADET